ncbi:MAG: DUF3854 domain-containing protein [Pyrinomonadaceae bacterium MAG19_C2-C3]|nr:DUF3854 domain-containing protein [Pyrinomonadaceae bacterium MAG19_C2-C3]
MKHLDRQPLIPIYRLRVKCPVCGKADNCAATRDLTRAYCRRVVSAHPGRDGGWLHILVETDEVNHKPIAHATAPRLNHYSVEPSRSPLASRARRDAIYTALLRDHLRVESRHGDALTARGLAEETIAAKLYASTPMPDEAAKIVTNIIAAHGQPEGVPGFYYKHGCWHLHVGCWNRGCFIPVRDSAGRIVALVVRKDEPDARGKYVWLSSSSEYCGYGASPGVPPHFAAPDLARHTGEIVITEGALKADVISQLRGRAVCGLASVTTWKPEFGFQLRKVFPTLEHCSLAFDADFRTNRQVHTRLCQLGKALHRAGLSVSFIAWDERVAKGYDNYLLEVRNRAT